MTSSKYFTGLIASPYQVATLYIKYNCLIDIWVKFGCSELISYVPACDPIFTKIAKKLYDVIKKFEAYFSNSLSAGYSWYQISLFNKHLGEIWKLWVNFLRSRTFPQVLLKYPKNVMTSSKYLKHVVMSKIKKFKSNLMIIYWISPILCWSWWWPVEVHQEV